MNLWQISEETFNPKLLHTQETVYTIGSGYFGTRGTFEESYPGASSSTLLFGVFDDIAIGKEELANAPDWLLLKLFINGERFRLDRGKVLEYHRTLDMQKGLLSRFVHWESPNGIRLKITVERFASLADEHLGAIRFSVTAVEQTTAAETGSKADLDVVLWATLNTAVGNYDLMHWETIDQGRENELLWLHTQTRHSHVQLAQSMSFTTSAQGFQQEAFDSDIAPGIRLHGKLAPGATVIAEKIVVMYTSRDTNDPTQSVLEHHNNIMHSAGYDGLLAQHKEAWLEFWRYSDIIIEGDDKAQQAIRYNIYQLRISASSHDCRYSIAAKGLTGFIVVISSTIPKSICFHFLSMSNHLSHATCCSTATISSRQHEKKPNRTALKGRNIPGRVHWMERRQLLRQLFTRKLANSSLSLMAAANCISLPILPIGSGITGTLQVMMSLCVIMAQSYC